MRPGFHCAQRVVFFAAIPLLLTGLLSAQDSPSTPDLPAQHIGVSQDWSTQHVIYTRNGSVDNMMKVRNDPRFLNSYLLHDMREHGGQLQASREGSERSSEGNTPPYPAAEQDARWAPPLPRRNRNTKVDWAVSLGTKFGMAIGESPAMYTVFADSTPTCTVGSKVGDFMVFSLKAGPGVGSQANLLALTNLYSGTSPTGYCGAAPTFLFSYAIGSGGSLLSPVLSLDGKKVAWIENTSANHAILHVTKWLANEGTNATTGAVAIPTGASCTVVGSCDVPLDYTSLAYPGCTASTSINTNSEIYVDYPSDTAFVGADNGILYHAKGIFKGTPTVDFCIPVNTSAGIALSGGVYDSLLNPPEFFIADSKTLYAYTVGASSFTLKASYTYGNGTLTGPGPVLDAFNNFLYAFSAKDLANHTSVTQLPTSLGSHAVVPLGPASTNSWPVLFYGAFDNNYFTFGPANSKSTLYSCGTDPTTTTAQDLYAISFNPATGVMNTTPAMSANKGVNNGTNGTCSPISEFFDGTTDRIFVGMGEHSSTSGANMVTMWDVTTQLTNPSTTPKATATGYAGGASGIIADDNASAGAYPQAASFYFTTLAAGGTFTTCGANNYCAVKLTQSGLK